jgi:hypothetical protein
MLTDTDKNFRDRQRMTKEHQIFSDADKRQTEVDKDNRGWQRLAEADK